MDYSHLGALANNMFPDGGGNLGYNIDFNMADPSFAANAYSSYQSSQLLDQNANGSQPGFYPLGQHSAVLNEPVIIRTDNYQENAGHILASLNNQITVLEARIGEARKIAGEATAAAEQAKEAAQKAKAAQDVVDAAERSNGLKVGTKRTKMFNEIHAKMNMLLRVDGVGMDGTKDQSIPGPLRSGEEAELLANGVTKRAHPNWHLGVDDPTNTRFCNAVAKLCMESVEADEKNNGGLEYGNPNWDAILAMCKVYYRSRRKTYNGQNSEVGAQARVVKLDKTKNRSRKRAKADNHCKAVEVFREKHGVENTVGAHEVVQTDDVSSEHSDSGVVDPAIFEAHRARMGGGEFGLEVRRKEWHSDDLRLFNCHLKTIRRDMITTKAPRITGGDDKTNGGGGADGDGMSNGGSGGSKRKANPRYTRFKGMPANNNKNPPLPGHARNRGKKNRSAGALYQWMISPVWLAATGRTYEELGALPDPEDFTLFKLQLTREGLNKRELDYLADDES
ncbi:hypothetical protein FB45DRAFT_1025955 [Roridomyces roridus]|uniref:Uncharacterized protein n=1 Tax=Roridomyces roridus TaxID=1738132 RepID=A0AAD7BZT8_9AGAR|nr:hypothetical protein FB45DRAFT_1025955 [Roridomyces roridus]